MTRSTPSFKTAFLLLSACIFSFYGCKKEKTETSEDNIKITFSGIDTRYSADMEVTTDGGYIILATSTSTSSGNDIVLIRTDGNGNELWKKYLGGPYTDCAGGLDINNNGDIVLTGTYGFKPDFTERDSVGMYVAKLNSKGTLLWDSTYQYNIPNTYSKIGTSGSDIKFLSTGGEIIIGTVDSAGINDLLAVELDENSNRVSSDFRFGTFNQFDYAPSLELSSKEEFITINNTMHDTYTPFLVHFKRAGGLLSNIVGARDDQSYGDPSLGEAHQIIKDGSGFAVIGTTFQSTSDPQDIYFMKLDNNLNLVGSIQKFGKSSTIEEGTALVSTSDGGYLIAGTTNDEALIGAAGKRTDVYLIKLNSSGEKQWENTFGSVAGERVYAVREISSGYAVLSDFEASGIDNIISISLLNSQGKRR